MGIMRISAWSTLAFATPTWCSIVRESGFDGTSVLASYNNSSREAFISSLVSRMTVPEMVLQLFLFFGDSAVGKYSNNSPLAQTLSLAPEAGIGVIHDWYPMNKTQFNDLQRLNLEASRLKIPFMHTGECLHGVGSFNQSMFPQPLGMAASWDVDLVKRVGGAIGAEARSIGIHACFAPVLDICQDQRWGRCQEDWGEDHVFTSHMGVAYASGMSQSGNWSRQDAAIPVMKHFAAYGSPQSGINIAPFMGHGNREVLQNLLMPFKAVVELGGVGGVMMAYSEWDGIPSSVHPALYEALDDWGYEGFVISDDVGMQELQNIYMVTSTPADTIAAWFNAGGMISFYDYPLDVYLNATVDLVNNGTVALSTLQAKMERILGVKYDLGLFDNPYIPDSIDPYGLVEEHVPLTLEAAQKSIVLLENKNSTLPLSASNSSLKKIALVGPFSDILNYGDYSGQFGAYPVANSYTIRRGLLEDLDQANSSTELVWSTGANTWLYNDQTPIPGYHLSTLNGTVGGLSATYYAGINFTTPMVHKTEVPVGDWGLYPPPGLPSNNFSAVWEGYLHSDVDSVVDGWLGVAISYNSTAKIYVDGELLVTVPLTSTGDILSNIPSYAFTHSQNATAAPPGSVPFTFTPGAKHKIRLEFQAYNLYQKIENQSSLNAEILLFWNLVDRNSAISNAVSVAKDSDVVILALGANWNSDAENGDRGTMTLSANQTELADAIYALGKPVILVLEGGRPFAIPEYYNASSAVLLSYFGGQQGGKGVADVLLGKVNPGGRTPLTIPRHVGQMPVYYNYKASAHVATYVDIESTPMYSFGYGLSYSNFNVSGFSANVNSSSARRFGANDTITFETTVTNTGIREGSYVPQVYLLQRVSQISQPVRQLVAFSKVYLDAGQSKQVSMEVDVNRYLRILNRKYEFEVEKGTYTFALAENGGIDASTAMNVTLRCTG